MNGIKKKKLKTFLEIVYENGHLRNLLLKNGLNEIRIDLNSEACKNNNKLNFDYVNKNLYEIFNVDAIKKDFSGKFDLIISSMVIEHLTQQELFLFFNKMKQLLNENGEIIILVPSSMKHWDIEDEIAGHVKRYEFEEFHHFEKLFSLKVIHLAGLTYPISNLLFLLSNRLIRKQEGSKLNLNQKEKTIYTGNREVKFKTKFPYYYKYLLNNIILYPFHLLQKIFKKNKNCLVIYCELKPFK